MTINHSAIESYYSIINNLGFNGNIKVYIIYAKKSSLVEISIINKNYCFKTFYLFSNICFH